MNTFTVFLSSCIPVVGVLGLVLEALEGEILVIQQSHRRLQTERSGKVGNERLARQIKLGVDIVGPISLEERYL